MRLREKLEHMYPICRLVPLIRKSSFLHEIQVRRHEKIYLKKYKESDIEDFKRFYILNTDKIDKVKGILEDEISVCTLENLIMCRLGGKLDLIRKWVVKPQYFVLDFLHFSDKEVFIDGGAYNGDTIREFSRVVCGQYQKIYAWEPDQSNRTILLKNTSKMEKICYIPYGMWKDEDTLFFSSDASVCSHIAKTGSECLKVNSIDNICKDEEVTFIKMDIEGSEYEALQGAKSTIKRMKPKLAICIYHKPSDLVEIPLLLKEYVPEYKFYIRQHEDSRDETVLYATL